MGGRARLLTITGIPVVLLVGVVLAANLLGGGEDPTGAEGGGTLTIGASENPDTLDPQRTNLNISAAILSYAGDALVTKTPDGEIVPSLARSWDVSEDGRVYTFELKRGVDFHDGTPLDAEAVEATVERALDP